jgi:hypothetical protein
MSQVRDPYFFIFSFKSKLNNGSKIVRLVKNNWGIENFSLFFYTSMFYLQKRCIMLGEGIVNYYLCVNYKL